VGRRAQARGYARVNRPWLKPLPRRIGVDDPIYGRLCRSCGHSEFSLDRELIEGYRECPGCGG
jgi:hypothetical protein